jgi:hypothetical protein
LPVLAALPAIPGVSCPTAALALGGAGLGTVCQVASGVTGAAGSAVSGLAGSAASSVAGFGVDSVLNALGNWVSTGATWLLAQIGSALGATTSIDLSASWFTDHYRTMAALAGVVVLPLLLLGIIQSIYRQNASALVRSVVVNVPLAVLLTAVAVKLVQIGLAVTDAMSNAVASGSGLDAGHFMSSVSLALSGTALVQPAAPAFVVFLGSLVVVFGAVLVWIELLIRAAAVYVAVLFLPLALASLAWPAIAHWCRRLVDTLVALILGKFVIVSVLSLAAGALAGAGGKNGGGFTAVLGGAALLLLSAFAPWALFRLLPFVEAGAVGHLEGLSHRARQAATVPARGLAQVAMRAAGAGSLSGAAASMIGGALRGAGAGAAGGGASGGLAGSLTGGRGGGPGPGGGTGPRGTGPGGAGSGPHGPSGSPPDMGPSSAEATGVGTTSPPAQGIPMYPGHGPASEAANRLMDELGLEAPSAPSAPERPVLSPGPAGSPVAATVLTPLPRQSGTVHADALGRDRLGIQLVAARQPPADRRPGDGQPGGGAGG